MKVVQIARKNNNNNWRYKYPECPGCKAIGEKGLIMTRLGNHYSIGGQVIEHNCLHCRSCNEMYVCKFDRNFNIKAGRSLSD